MSSINSLYSSMYGMASRNRITGMFSGLDTDTLIQNLLKTEQSKVDTSYKAKTKLEWKRDAYNEINSTLKSFQEKYLSALSDKNMWSTKAYSQYTTNLANNRFIDAKATSSAFDTQYSIVGAKKAGYAELSGSKYISRSQAMGYVGQNQISKMTGDKTVSANTALADLEGIGEGDRVSFAINGQTFVFDKETTNEDGTTKKTTLQDVIDEVNSKSSKTNVKMSIGDDGKVTLANIKAGEDAKIEIEDMSGGLFKAEDGVLGLSAENMEKVSTIDTTAALSELSNSSTIFGSSNSIKIAINGKEFTFNKTDSLDDVLDTINNSGIGVKMEYNAEKDQFSIKSDDPTKKLEIKNVQGNFFDANGSIGINENTAGLKTYDTIARAATKLGIEDAIDENGKLNFTINGKDFSFDAKTTTLEKMMSAINGDSDANVKMSYSEITDSFTLRSASTGAAQSVTFSAGDEVAKFFRIDANSTAVGTDASITFDTGNGTTETITQSQNSFTIDGINYTIKEDFDADTDGGELRFGVTQDVDSVVNKVKEFVQEYNKIVESLNDKIHEKKNYKFDVLTEEERKELGEASKEDLAAWDEKAKSGILRNDNSITNFLSSMRNALFEKVGDTGLSASDIGLSTGTWDKYGQISLDEDKLRAALEKDPDVVGRVLANTSSSSDATTARAENGLMTRIYNDISKYQKDIKTNVLTTVEKNISNYESKIEEQLEKMYEKQEKYYQQFAQLERIMAQYSSQSNYFSQLTA